MWMQRIDGSPMRKLSSLLALKPTSSCTDWTWSVTPAATSTTLPGLPFSNWGLASQAELHALLSGRNDGGRGDDYLEREAHISKAMLVWVPKVCSYSLRSGPSQAILDRRERAHGEDYWWAGTTG